MEMNGIKLGNLVVIIALLIVSIMPMISMGVRQPSDIMLQCNQGANVTNCIGLNERCGPRHWCCSGCYCFFKFCKGSFGFFCNQDYGKTCT